MCDGTTSVDEPCDSLCGGAGCGKCGGLSCLEGALSKATEAVNSANYADQVLREKDVKAERGMRITLLSLSLNFVSDNIPNERIAFFK